MKSAAPLYILPVSTVGVRVRHQFKCVCVCDNTCTACTLGSTKENVT